MSFSSSFIITDCQEQGILGMDFLLKHGCQINLFDLVLTINNKIVPLRNQNHQKLLARVKLVEPTVVPPLSEKVATAVVLLKSTSNMYYGTTTHQHPKSELLTGIVEPIQSEHSQHQRFMIARSLSSVPANSNQILIRLLNVSEHPITVSSRRALAKFHLLDDSETIVRVASTCTPAEDRSRATHIQPLLDNVPPDISTKTWQIR
jgi:hypothetical protein